MKSLPKSQVVWVTTKIGENIFVTTSNKNRTTYNLYRKSQDGYIKIKTAISHVVLDKEIEKLTKGE